MTPSITALLLAMAAFCALEALLLRAQRKRLPRANDFVSGLFCGLLDHLVNAGAFVAFAVLYAHWRARWAPVRLPVNPLTWVAIVLVHDLAYYWFHRVSHRVAALWAAHEVHHQSDDYTLAVSLRQGTIATWISWLFYAPLAFMGFSVEQFVAVHLAHQCFQFFVHTRVISTMGPLEWLLATPSHHRVHHGREESQIDRNYGGFLIVWDRLFGTFAPETEEPKYGVPEGIASWSPFWANLAPYRKLLARTVAQKSAREALRALFGPPASDRDVSSQRADYDACPPTPVQHYALTQSAAIAWVALVFVTAPSLGATINALVTAWLLVSMATIAHILDARPSWRMIETARIFVTGVAAIAVAVTGAASPVIAAVWAGAALWSLIVLVRVKRVAEQG